MSHNKIKVGGQSPNTSGEISVALNNLSDLSVSSPSDNQVLQYSSGSWIPASRGSQASKELVYSYKSAFTGSYSGGTSNYNLTNNALNRFRWRITGGTIVENGVNHKAIVFSSTAAWRSGFEFVSTGTYLIFMSLQHYGTGNAIWQFYDETNSSYFGSKFRMSATGDKMPLVVQTFTTTVANQELSLRLQSITTPSGVGTPSEMRAVSINVYKV
jgi:hypothetical protein